MSSFFTKCMHGRPNKKWEKDTITFSDPWHKRSQFSGTISNEYGCKMIVVQNWGMPRLKNYYCLCSTKWVTFWPFKVNSQNRKFKLIWIYLILVNTIKLVVTIYLKITTNYKICYFQNLHESTSSLNFRISQIVFKKSKWDSCGNSV